MHRRGPGPGGDPGARELISGLVRLLAFQGAGELVSVFLLPAIPGPVLGLILLVAWLRLRARVPEDLDAVAGPLTAHLGLLFVPAAVGVVMYWPQLRAHALAISLALVASVVLTIAVAALVLRVLARKEALARKDPA